MFITPDAAPAADTAISDVIDQKALCDRYSIPAPPASTILASLASPTRGPSAIKTAAPAIPTPATPQRPIRFPNRFESRSLIQPPSGEQMAIAMNGNIPYSALVFRSRLRTLFR